MNTKESVLSKRKLALFVITLFVISMVTYGLTSGNMEIKTGTSNTLPYTTQSNGTLSEGIVTTVLQSSFDYWSPVEDYFATSMLYLPFATPNFPPLPSTQFVIGQSVNHNKEYTSWNLSLKKGLKWDNGSPLNSTDLWFSMKVYIQLNEFPNALNITSVTIVNSTTINIRTNTPEPDLYLSWLYDTNSYIMPYQSFYPHDRNLSAGSSNITTIESFSNYHDIVADGPFVITNYTPGEDPILFKANPYYFQGKPEMSCLEFRIFTSAASESAAMKSGEISAMWDNAPYNTKVAPLFEGISNSQIQEIEPGEYEEASFNMHEWPYNTTQFRQALAYITNVSPINDIVNSASSPLVCHDELTSDLGKDIGISAGSLNNYSYNMGKAESLLKQIGIEKDNISGTANYGLFSFTNPNLPCYGNPVTINITTAQFGYGDLSTSVELSDQWKSAGFKTDITSITDSTIYAEADSAKGWSVMVWPDPSGYPPVPAYIESATEAMDNSTAYNAHYKPSFGMENYNVSVVCNLINESYRYSFGSSQSNLFVKQLAEYFDLMVPNIPIYDAEWWVAVSDNYYWGNFTNHTGVFSTQDLLVSTFYYGALYLVHPIKSISSVSFNYSIYYYTGGSIAVVVVIGSIVGLSLRKKHKKEKEKRDEES